MIDLSLIQFKLSMQCIESGYVAGIGGAECHGLFFSMLDKIDPQYATAIHRAPVKPFSIGKLGGRGRRERGYFHLLPDNEYSFHLNSLDEECATILELMTGQIRPQHMFRLGTATCRWLKWEVVKKKDYPSIFATNKANKPSLRFISPTCFRSQGKSLLFPQPVHLFSSLESRWNRFAHEEIDLGNIDEQIMVSKYNLRTTYTMFNRYNQVGFTGQVGFSWHGRVSGEVKQQVNALLSFAQFSGVGYKTSMGMGEIRI